RPERAAGVPRARPAHDAGRGGAGMKGLVNSVADADGLGIGGVANPDISEVLKRPGRFVWVGLHEPDDEMLAEIQQEFSLHDLAVEDAARAHQRPKLERYGESIFVVLRTAHIDSTTGGIDYGETHLFVGLNYIVSVRHGGSLPYVEGRSPWLGSGGGGRSPPAGCPPAGGRPRRSWPRGPSSSSTRSWISSSTSTSR